MIFVSSWDDGHPLDQRLAELHAERGLQATFYVPLRNCEGRPVMGSADLRAIDALGFEVGSHTADHFYLDKLPPEEAERQIVTGKDGLEQMIGRAISGFSYPGGRRPTRSSRWLQRAGITYARTVENLRTDLNFAPYAIPTTVQFYPHRISVWVRNMLRSPNHLAGKLRLIASATRHCPGAARCLGLIETSVDANDVFHLWGHSWEIDRLNAWNQLAHVLDVVASRCTTSLTVGQLASISRPIAPYLKADR